VACVDVVLVEVRGDVLGHQDGGASGVVDLSNIGWVLHCDGSADLRGEQGVVEVSGADVLLPEPGPDRAGFVGAFVERLAGAGEDERAVREGISFVAVLYETDRDRLTEGEFDGGFDRTTGF
jgi:hypothetical protein